MSYSEEIRTLVASTNSGRYALDDSECGGDLTTGQPVLVKLAGVWIEGRVEYGKALYLGGQSGYYLETCDGKCGLCVGMQVRLWSRW